MKKILFVDDDPILGQLFPEMARAVGYEADTASSTEVALELLNKNDDYRILVLDQNLAGDIKGSSFAKIAKEFREKCRIILTSGDQTIKDNLSGTVDAFLKKPFTVEMLKTILEKNSIE